MQTSRKIVVEYNGKGNIYRLRNVFFSEIGCINVRTKELERDHRARTAVLEITYDANSKPDFAEFNKNHPTLRITSIGGDMRADATRPSANAAATAATPQPPTADPGVAATAAMPSAPSTESVAAETAVAPSARPLFPMLVIRDEDPKMDLVKRRGATAVKRQQKRATTLRADRERLVADAVENIRREHSRRS